MTNIDNDKVLTDARSVLALAKRAVVALDKSLGQPFVDAVSLILNTKGSVIVTGMGKSGHIAGKIAATFASTGTRAQCIHPAEASHGDMGMIGRQDVIVALSNSGETAELGNLLAYARSNKIATIAITGRAQSTLATKSDIVLLLADIPEAGAVGLAPTTSTTQALMLGDALAIAVTEQKNFSAPDFHQFHPGGRLGSYLLCVNEIMHIGDEMPLVGETMLMKEAIVAMASRRFGCIGVVDAKGEFVGMITDGDLRRHMNAGFLDQRAGDVMTKSPYVAGPDDLIREVLEIMNGNFFGAMFVVKNKRPIGILHIHDIVQLGFNK